MKEEIQLGGLAIRFMVQGRDSAGSIAMFEFDVAAGAKMPIAHSHDAYEETVYGLAGLLTFTVNGERIEIGPHDSYCIPRGAVHRFDNFHSEKATVLAIVTPGILGPEYFREIAATLKVAAGGPPDHVALAAIMRRHGLTPAM